MPGLEEQRRILLHSLFLNSILVLIDLAGYFLGNSTLLLAAAFHDFSDSVSLFISYRAVRLAEKPPTRHMTYGFQRATVLAALLNGVVLIVLTLYAVYQAVQRLLNPVQVGSNELIGVGLVAIAVNAGIAYRLWAGRSDVNLRIAFWDIASDVLGGAMAVLVGVIIALTNWYGVDAAASLLLSAVVFWNVGKGLTEAVRIVMEAAPPGLDVTAVEREIKRIPGVLGVHDFHAWSLGSESYALSAHIDAKDAPLGELTPLLHEVKNMLRHRFNIHHATLELECVDCEIKIKPKH